MPNEFSKKSPERSPSPGFGERGRASGKGGGPRQPRISLADEIIALDDELIGLLTRRGRLITKMRGGKTHAANPGAIKSEKQIRSNWEVKAGRISRDSRFIRELYHLIQDITVQQRDPEKPGSAFNLAPARLPLAMELPGPSISGRAMLWLALAASFGKELRVEGLQRSQAIMDFVKAFSQTGANLSWAGGSGVTENSVDGAPTDQLCPDPHWADALLSGGGQPLSIRGKTIYIGENPLVFYLLAFMALSGPGKVKFTAGHALKSANLTPLYKMLPDLGARLSFVVPSSKGLPASLECSGQLPQLYQIPADLPLEGLLGLLLAALTWKKPLVLSLDSLPGKVAHQALSIMEPFFTAFTDAAEVRGPEVHYNAWEGPASDIWPPSVQAGLEPVPAAITLSMPFFTGGEVTLLGRWPELPDSAACIGLLRKAGLKIEIGHKKILASGSGKIASNLLEGGIVAPDLPDALLPLFWVLNARIAAEKIKYAPASAPAGQEAPAGLALHAVPENANLRLASDFLAQLGLDLRQEENGMRISPLPKEEATAVAAKTHGWSSPGPLWTMAFSLGAFFRANLKISNPDSVTDLIPAYWAMYNSLPSPRTRSAAREEKPARRRIMTDKILDVPADRDDEDANDF